VVKVWQEFVAGQAQPHVTSDRQPSSLPTTARSKRFIGITEDLHILVVFAPPDNPE